MHSPVKSSSETGSTALRIATYLKRCASAVPMEVVSFWQAACSARLPKGALPVRKKRLHSSRRANVPASTRPNTCSHSNSAGSPSSVQFTDLSSCRGPWGMASGAKCQPINCFQSAEMLCAPSLAITLEHSQSSRALTVTGASPCRQAFLDLPWSSVSSTFGCLLMEQRLFHYSEV